MSTLWQDLRYGIRTLRNSPGFTLVALVSLALGIGANTAIFQLLDALRLRTLPVQDPQRLAVVKLADQTGIRGMIASWYPALTNPQWERFRDTQTAFSGVAAVWNNNLGLTAEGDGRIARGLFVSGDFFRVLGVHALAGRVFTAADDHRSCGAPGAVVSYSFWQGALAGDPAVIGRKLVLNYVPVEVIGVTPAGFTGIEVGRSYDVAVPICSQAVLWSDGNWLDEGTAWWLTVVGRLKPGESLETANANLRAVSPGFFQATLPANYPAVDVKHYLNFKLTADAAGNGLSHLRSDYSEPLILLLTTAGLVLLIACANLANLMLARATSREREIAVRLAIGASRLRLIRQWMSEALLLALGGAGLGLLLSSVLSEFLVSLLATPGHSLFLDLTPDRPVLAFTIAVAVLVCVLFGVAPALRASGVPPGDAMKATGRGLTAGRERFGLRRALVVSQVALSMVLVVGALLFSGSLRNLLAVDTGFRETGVLIAGLDFRRLTLPADRRVAFQRDLVERVRRIPGVEAAAQTGLIPISGDGRENAVWPDGAPGAKLDSDFAEVSDGYFKTMGTALLAGRDFDGHDSANSPKVAIVNQTLARRLGLGVNPVGRRFRREATPSEPEAVFEIVGLVRDTKYFSLREPFQPIAFTAAAQNADPGTSAQLVIRSGLPLGTLTAAIKSAMGGMAPGMSFDFDSLEATVRESLLRERLMATLSGFFGGLAALIAAIGLYGVMSYLVARRTSEIGLRMALGADKARILRLILREAGTLLAIGLGVGIALSLLVARAAETMLFGLKANDVGTLVAAAAALAAVTGVASYLPARRAARLDPMVALREE